jgi:hypothetical protein
VCSVASVADCALPSDASVPASIGYVTLQSPMGLLVSESQAAAPEVGKPRWSCRAAPGSRQDQLFPSGVGSDGGFFTSAPRRSRTLRRRACRTAPASSRLPNRDPSRAATCGCSSSVPRCPSASRCSSTRWSHGRGCERQRRGERRSPSIVRRYRLGRNRVSARGAGPSVACAIASRRGCRISHRARRCAVK